MPRAAREKGSEIHHIIMRGISKQAAIKYTHTVLREHVEGDWNIAFRTSNAPTMWKLYVKHEKGVNNPVPLTLGGWVYGDKETQAGGLEIKF